MNKERLLMLCDYILITIEERLPLVENVITKNEYESKYVVLCTLLTNYEFELEMATLEEMEKLTTEIEQLNDKIYYEVKEKLLAM